MKNSIAQRCQFDDKISQARLWGDQIIAISSKGYLYLIEPNLGVAVMKPRKLMIDDENLDLTFLAQIENGSKSKEKETAKENATIAQPVDQIEIENQQVQEPAKSVEAAHVEGATNRGRLEIEEEDVQAEEEHKENQEISKPEENLTGKIEIENHDQPLPEAKPATVNEEEEVEERKEERKKAGSKWIKFLERIGSLPQHPIQTGSTTAQFGKQQLRSNTFGKAVSYHLQEEAQIEVEYIDSSLSRKQIIGNTKAYNMCDLGAKGFVLARSGQAANIEEYEDEEETAQAEIFFQALGSDFNWTRHFSAGEALIQVSISSTLVAACSSRGTLYTFSLGGSLISTISVPGSVVALCTFEHLAAVIVSHSLPVDGAQNLTLRLYDLRALSCELLTSLPLSPGSGLIWAGFGDDGSFVTQDSSGIVRLLIEKEIWIPVHVDESERRFWIVGVIDCELVGHFLSHNELEPTLDRKYPIIRLPFGCVQPETKLTFSEEEGNIFFDVMKNKFEREKYRLHRHTKHSQISDPLQRLFQDSIKEPHEIAVQEFEAETKKVNLIRRLAVESSEEYRALQYALQLKSEKHFEVLNDLLGYAKHKKLAENIKRSANDHGLMSYISSNSLGANIALPSSLTEKPKPKPKAKIIEEKEEEGHTFADHKQEIDQAIQKSEEAIQEEKKVQESSSNGFPASINGKPTKNLFTAMAECGDSKNRKPAKRVNR